MPLLGNVVISKKNPMHKQDHVMHRNERGEYRLRTIVDRKRKCYGNAVNVVERLHDPTDPSTECTAPPCSAHVQHDDVPQALDPVEGPGRVPSARRRGDGDDEVTGAGLRLNSATI